MLFMAVISFFLMAGIIAALAHQTTTQSDFGEGAYANTFYNGSLAHVRLNATNTTGNYTSKTFNAGFYASWDNITWTSNAIGELPPGQNNETGHMGSGANMSGCVLLMHFNMESGLENDTHFYDWSGTGNNGTCTQCPTFNATGRMGGAFDFNGSGQYISVPYSASLNPDTYTVSAWFNSNGSAETQRIIYSSIHSFSEIRYRIGITTSGAIYGGYYSQEWKSSISPNGLINNHTWYHVALTYSGHNSTNTTSLYVNGKMVGQDSHNASLPSNDNDLGIGIYYRGTDTGYFMNGTLDEIAIWNRSLSGSEILGLYKRGVIRLNLSVRSCNSSSCSAEGWKDITNNTSPQPMSISENQYFQYFFGMETDNSSLTPELYNVTINYVRASRTTELNMSVSLTLNHTNHMVCVAGNRINSSQLGSSLIYNAMDRPYAASYSYSGNGKVAALIAKNAYDIAVSNATGSHTIKINHSMKSSYSMLVFTKGDWKAIDERIALITGGQFMTKIAPSFAFGLGLTYPIKMVLNLTGMDMQKGTILNPGRHDLLLDYNSTSDNRPVFEITAS